MADTFHDAKLRLSRAKEHILSLEGKISAFNATKPYTLIIEPDSDGVNQLHKIKFAKPLSDEFAATVADAVDNLRSSLDQAWYAVAIASDAISPTGKAYFPFADSAFDFTKKLEKGCKHFPLEILGLLREFKPYKGGDDLLWALNRISASNKHRMLAPVLADLRDYVFNHLGFEEGIPIPCFPILPYLQWDRKKNEIVWAISKISKKMEYKVDFAFLIIFDEVDIVRNQPVLIVLNALARKVEDILEALEGELRVLGFM
jgi:hypothetical protein